MRTGCNLGKHGHNSAEQVEDKIATSTHRIFDFGTESPQENHVADDVRPAAVHEHRRQNRDPVMAGSNLGWNHGPLSYERLAPHQLHHENEDVNQNDEYRYHWDTDRTSRRIA